MALSIRGIQHLNLTVRDLVRSRSFYEALGFTVSFAKGETVWLEAGGDLLGLSLGEPPAVRRFEHFGFIVDSNEDVDRWARELVAREVEIEKGPYDRSDGRSVYFRDPDGYLLEIFHLDPGFLAESRN